jgi:beta-glucosidase
LGAATSAYQIEGAVHAAGRGESVWDRYSHTPGKTFEGGTGDVACDHYDRFREDVQLMARLGLSAYRFSVAWPRVIPDGSGTVNSKGLDFYDLLVDELLTYGITPFVTLYHWDLPQALEDKGGWYVRDTADAFAIYTEAVVRRLGDRVQHWITLNEPWVQAWLGYGSGIHAPGRTDGDAGGVKAGHNLLRGHGKAMQVIRHLAPEATAGITLDFSPMFPASDSEPDARAAALANATKNGWFVEPIAMGAYPAEATELIAHLPPEIDSDMAEISAPVDFMGVNYYTSGRVAADPETGEPRDVPFEDVAHMDSGWQIFPDGLRSLLVRLGRDYGIGSLYVTENGAAFADQVSSDGRVHDERRVKYIADHVRATAQAAADGAPVKGYFAWSLMDNFEWGSAYDENTRFGLVRIDFKSLQRTPKDSAEWYAGLIAARRADE